MDVAGPIRVGWEEAEIGGHGSCHACQIHNCCLRRSVIGNATRTRDRDHDRLRRSDRRMAVARGRLTRVADSEGCDRMEQALVLARWCLGEVPLGVDDDVDTSQSVVDVDRAVAAGTGTDGDRDQVGVDDTWRKVQIGRVGSRGSVWVHGEQARGCACDGGDIDDNGCRVIWNRVGANTGDLEGANSARAESSSGECRECGMV